MIIKDHNSESGFVLALFPVVVVSLLGVLGMTVDSSNLYAAKVKAGAAAEQGVLSAVGSHLAETDQAVRAQFGQKGDPPGSSGYLNEETYLRTRFEFSATSNLVNNGVLRSNWESTLSTKIFNNLAGDVQFNHFVDRGVTQVTGKVSLEVPVFFRGIYDLIGKAKGDPSNVVTAYATSEIKGSAFVLVLDLSASQGCPSVGDCTCKTAQRVGACQGRIRIEDIREATRNVIRSLDRKRDRLSILFYNNATLIAYPMDGTPGFFFNDALDKIINLGPEDRGGVPFPNGNTNVSDAVLTARDQLAAANTPDLEGRKNVILLSDGSPTAMRINPVATEAQKGGGDYISFQLSKALGTGPNDFITFPGPLVRRSGYPVNGVNGRSPMVPATVNPNGGYDVVTFLPECHQVTLQRVIQQKPLKLEDYQAADPDLFTDDDGKRIAALQRCLNNNSWNEGSALGFNSSLFSVDGSMQRGSTIDFRQMYYLAAVKAVEQLYSSTKARLFTLSWGDIDNGVAGDLFNYASVAGVKFNYLRNLANNPPPKSARTGDWDLWSQNANLFGGNVGFSAKTSRKEGRSFVAFNANQFRVLFRKIIIYSKLSVIDVRPHDQILTP